MFWFVAVLHSAPPARPGSTKGIHPCDGSAQCRGYQCTALSPQLLVALKFARRLAISAARCSAKRCLSSLELELERILSQMAAKKGRVRVRHMLSCEKGEVWGKRRSARLQLISERESAESLNRESEEDSLRISVGRDCRATGGLQRHQQLRR